MSSRFDRLTLLETFSRIAERKSLSGAARDLGISQPSVSRQLATLEERLGTVLVRRTTHELTLTPDGLTLLADARRLTGEWEAIEDRHAQDGELSGTIRVIAPVALGQSLFIKAAAPFLRENPNITIDWRLSDEPIRFAEEGCDCWLKVGPVPDDTLIVRELARVERLIVATPECIAAHEGVALDALPWLTLGPFEGNQIELFDQNETSQVFSVTPRLASDNIFVVHEAMMQGVGIAIMPHWFVASDLKNETLIDVEPGLRAERLPVNLAIAAGTRRPARVERFCDSIQTWCQKKLGAPV